MTLGDLVEVIRETGISLEDAKRLELSGISRAQVKDGKIQFFKPKPKPPVQATLFTGNSKNG